MHQKRRERISSLLRNEIAMIIHRELKDPRIGFVSVLAVHPTEDLKEAEVRVSLMGSESQQRTSLRGLQAARGYIQTLLAGRVRMRNTPALKFVLDDSISKQLAIDELLRKARDGELPEDDVPEEAGAAEEHPSEEDPGAEKPEGDS